MDFDGQTEGNSINCHRSEKMAIVAEKARFWTKKQDLLNLAPVAQVDRASVYGTEG